MVLLFSRIDFTALWSHSNGEHLLSKCEAQSSSPKYCQNKKEKE
jgi:hypothetical protein